MTIRSFASLTLVVLWAGFVHAEENKTPDTIRLMASLNTWHHAKKQCQGNYTYRVRFSSFTGAGHETKFVVEKNKVVQRRFQTFPARTPRPIAPGTKPAPSKGRGWVEKNEAIGTNKEGAPAKTLDDHYATALEIAREKLKPHEKRYVRFDKAGLLLSCFIVDTRIADDAPRRGVALSGISLSSRPGTPPTKATVHKAPNGKPFPPHWGAPPRIQTRDYRPLPGGYGNGSGTLAKWIQSHLDKDSEK